MPGPWRELGRYGTVGLELALTILIVAGIGHWLDLRYWPGKNWGLLVGFALGAAAAFRNLMRTSRQMQRGIERAEAQDPAASRWTVDESWLNDGTSPAAPGDDPGGSSKPKEREAGSGHGPKN
jgi:hypothetical protein